MPKPRCSQIFMGKIFKFERRCFASKLQEGIHTKKIWLLHIQIAIVCSVRLNIWYDQILDITAHNDYILNSRNVGKLQTVDTRPFSSIFWMGMGTRLRRANHRLVLYVYQWFYNVQSTSDGGQPCLRDNRASALSAKFCTDQEPKKLSGYGIVGCLHFVIMYGCQWECILYLNKMFVKVRCPYFRSSK